MNRNKYSIARLKHLLAMLKENRYPNYPRFLAEMKRLDVAGTYQLSARTLQRDVAFLKSEYGAPIHYDFERKGYYLTCPDWSIDIPLWEENEMKAAVLGARLAENILPQPVRQEVREAVDSLLSVNEKGVDEYATLLSLVAMGSKVAIRPAVFRAVFDGWQTHRSIALTYESVDGKHSQYVLEPHVLAFYEGNWYTRGYVVAKNGSVIAPEKRGNYVFALHRVTAAELLEREFNPDAKLIESVNKHGLFEFPQIKGVRMRLGKEAYKFIGEQFDFEEEKAEGEFHIVKVLSAPAYRIINFVLVEGGDAKLLNHPELQAEVIQRAKKCIAAQKEK